MRKLALALSLALSATPAVAAQGMYSYVPADAETRALADNGFTIVFDKGMMGGVLVLKIMSTEAPAAAELEPADGRELGAPLRSLIGNSDASDLYRIGDKGQGPAMVRAFCPGSRKGWLAFGPVKVRRDLEIRVLGDDAATGKARACATLNFTFRGEWKTAPAANRPPTARVMSQ